MTFANDCNTHTDTHRNGYALAIVESCRFAEKNTGDITLVHGRPRGRYLRFADGRGRLDSRREPEAHCSTYSIQQTPLMPLAELSNMILRPTSTALAVCSTTRSGDVLSFINCHRTSQVLFEQPANKTTRCPTGRLAVGGWPTDRTATDRTDKKKTDRLHYDRSTGRVIDWLTD